MNRPRGMIEVLMDQHREVVQRRIEELESRRLRLEELRLRVRRLGGPEGERLEAQAKDALKKVSQQLHDLKASLE
jgi:hypothetical protein